MRLRLEQALAGWTLVFEVCFDIVNIWGAEIVARAPGRYLLRSVDWRGRWLPTTPWNSALPR